MFDSTSGAWISSPSSSRTPEARPFFTRICATGAATRMAPPLAWNDAPSALLIAPMPPRANPQAPTVSSMSPM